MILERAAYDETQFNLEDDDEEDPYIYMKTGLYILSISSFAYYFYSKRNMI